MYGSITTNLYIFKIMMEEQIEKIKYIEQSIYYKLWLLPLFTHRKSDVKKITELLNEQLITLTYQTQRMIRDLLKKELFEECQVLEDYNKSVFMELYRNINGTTEEEAEADYTFLKKQIFSENI